MAYTYPEAMDLLTQLVDLHKRILSADNDGTWQTPDASTRETWIALCTRLEGEFYTAQGDLFGARDYVVDLIAANNAVAYPTRAELYSNLAPAANTLGFVVNDPTTTYNGVYIKAGASGAGSWTPGVDRISAISTAVAPLVTPAEYAGFETDLCGYPYVEIDVDGRILGGIDYVTGDWVRTAFSRIEYLSVSQLDVAGPVAAESLSGQSIAVGGYSIYLEGESDLTGYLWVEIDANQRILASLSIGLLQADHLPKTTTGPAEITPAPMVQYSESADVSSTVAVYTVSLDGIDIDVMAEDLSTRVVTRLSNGGRNTRPVLTADSSRVIWCRESDGAIVTAPAAGGDVVKAFSDRRIVGWGHSMMSGYGGSDWSGANTHAVPQMLAAELGKRVINRGMNSLTAKQVAVHMGALIPLITVSGGMIPSSGPVNVSLDHDEYLSDFTNIGIYGSINGVAGLISRATTAGQPVFRRTADGVAVAVSAATPILVTGNANEYYSDKVADTDLNQWINIFWCCYNSKLDPVGNRATVNAMVANLRSWKKKYLILSDIPGNLDRNTSGQNKTNYDGIIQTNAYLAADHGPFFVDLIAPLQAANDGSTQDLLDVSQGIIPASLRADDVHPNNAGYVVVKDVVKSKLTSLGWHH